MQAQWDCRTAVPSFGILLQHSEMWPSQQTVTLGVGAAEVALTACWEGQTDVLFTTLFTTVKVVARLDLLICGEPSRTRLSHRFARSIKAQSNPQQPSFHALRVDCHSWGRLFRLESPEMYKMFTRHASCLAENERLCGASYYDRYRVACSSYLLGCVIKWCVSLMNKWNQFAMLLWALVVSSLQSVPVKLEEDSIVWIHKNGRSRCLAFWWTQAWKFRIIVTLKCRQHTASYCSLSLCWQLLALVLRGKGFK